MMIRIKKRVRKKGNTGNECLLETTGHLMQRLQELLILLSLRLKVLLHLLDVAPGDSSDSA